MAGEGLTVGAGLRMGSGLRVSRRQAASLLGRLGLGIGGTLALVACGSSGGVEAVAAPTAKGTESAPAHTQASVPIGDLDAKADRPAPSELPAQRGSVEVSFATASRAGPRGAAMKWGLRRFADKRPDITVKVEPEDGVPTRFVAGTAPHIAQLQEGAFLSFLVEDRLVEISSLLRQMNVVKEDYYFVPDTYTWNDLDHSFPAPRLMQGPQFGMPFQIEISGFVANATLAEVAGVSLPDGENSWTWDSWSELDAKMTDPEAGTFGTWVRQDYHRQYMPLMHSNGLKKPFDDSLTKTMFDQPEALEAWEYLISKATVHRTSPALDETPAVSGDYSNPFAAGKIGIWPGGRAFSTGYGLAKIKERFRWTLLPEPVAIRGGAPAHLVTETPNLVSSSATRDGLEEQATALAVYLAGEEFQGRVGIERGHMPVHKTAIGAPTSVAPPPDGMQWLKVYADRPANRSRYYFGSWWDWWQHNQTLGHKGWTGEQMPAEALEACQAWGIKHLAEYQGRGGREPFVREPVYP